MKSAIADSVDAPEIDLGAKTSKNNGRAEWRRPIMALAACLVLFMAAGLAWSIIEPTQPVHGVPVAWAIETHSAWSQANKPLATLRPANVQLNAHVPDLSAARLRIAHIGETKTLDGRTAMVVGYLGTRGCRVTLLIDKSSPENGGKAIFFRVQRLIAMVWRAGSLRHVILAEGMAEAQFKLIAETVRRTSLERLPINDPTRMALAQSREKSPPCAA